jgi:hypothetical protein
MVEISTANKVTLTFDLHSRQKQISSTFLYKAGKHKISV